MQGSSNPKFSLMQRYYFDWPGEGGDEGGEGGCQSGEGGCQGGDSRQEGAEGSSAAATGEAFRSSAPYFHEVLAQLAHIRPVFAL
jgi:hypothetical protein